MTRLLLAVALFVAVQEDAIAEPVNFIDASSPDPMSVAKAHVGGTKDEFKKDFPTNKGIAFSPNCTSMIRARYKDGRVTRVEIWNYPLATDCGSLAFDTMRSRYGAPESGNYGYSSAVGVMVLSSSIDTFRWRLDGFDVIMLQHHGNTASFIIDVMKPGTWKP